jgi:hypothetical protein
VPLKIAPAVRRRLLLDELDLPQQISAEDIKQVLVQSTEGPTGGRLMNYLDFWARLLPQDKLSQDWQRNGGMSFHVTDCGPQAEFQKPKMDRISDEERERCMRKATELENEGVLEEVPENEPTKEWHERHGWVHEILSESFTQEKKDKLKLRWLTNMRKSGGNERMQGESFKQDGPHTVKRDAQQGDETIALDLTDAYFQPTVERVLRKLLTTLVWWRKKRRRLRRHKRGVMYSRQPVWQGAWYLRKMRYRTLSQGQTNAPRLFTKLMQRILRVLSECGVRTQHKIDDVLISANVLRAGIRLETEEMERYRRCLTHAYITVVTLTRCGFKFNVTKSEVEPETIREWHGLMWCFKCMMCGAPPSKVTKVRKLMRNMAGRMAGMKCDEPLTVKVLSSSIGVGMSLMEAADGARSMLADHQEMRLWMMQQADWTWTGPVILGSIPTRLRSAVQKECRMWLRPSHTWNWRSFKKHTHWLAVVETDASGYGMGAKITVTRTAQSTEVVQRLGRPLTECMNECMMHITKTETRATKEYTCYTILRWDLRDGAILTKTDATTTRKYISQFGGRKHWYTREVMELQRLARARNLSIFCEWIPGLINHDPDYESRKIDLNEYLLQRAIYLRLQELWARNKVFAVDMFAGRWNKQMNRYCTFDLTDREALGVDAFAQNWNNIRRGPLRFLGTLYAFPPMTSKFCGRMATKIIDEQVDSIVVVVPLWRQGWLTSLLGCLTDWPRLLPCSGRPLQPPLAYSTADLRLPRYWTSTTLNCLITMRLSGKVDSPDRVRFQQRAHLMQDQLTSAQLEEKLAGIMLLNGDGSSNTYAKSLGEYRWILTTLQSVWS